MALHQQFTPVYSSFTSGLKFIFFSRMLRRSTYSCPVSPSSRKKRSKGWRYVTLIHRGYVTAGGYKWITTISRCLFLLLIGGADLITSWSGKRFLYIAYCSSLLLFATSLPLTILKKGKIRICHQSSRTLQTLSYVEILKTLSIMPPNIRLVI